MIGSLDQYQLDFSDVHLGFAISGVGWVAEDVLCGLTGNLTEIVLQINQSVAGSANLIVEIQGLKPPYGRPDIDNILASQEIDNASIAEFPAITELTVTFSTPVFFELGDRFAIVLHTKDDDGVVSYYLRGKQGGDPYPDGRSFVSNTSGVGWGAGSEVNDYYFKTYVLQYNTLWTDINTDIRVLNSDLNDINSDIRVVSTKTVLRDMNSIIYTADRILSDINCDIRVADEYLNINDINCDIRISSGDSLYDVNCDIRVLSEGTPTNNLTDISCDIRVLNKNLYDANCDIRVVEDGNEIYDINCDIRVRGVGDTEPTPTGLTGFMVYLNGNEITDVQLDSIKYDWTTNEQPAPANFRIVRKSDDFNQTLEDVAQAITTNLPIEIKFNENLRWYGYVMDLDVEQGGESVIVNCLDRKQKIQEKLYDIEYGRKWEYPEPGDRQITTGEHAYTGEAIIAILSELVTDGVISSYTGVPNGIIPEYNETEGMPAGTLLTELLDISGNFYWNVTPAGILEIYESASGNIINLPLQTEDKHIHLYDILNYNFKLNDRSNLITTVEVNMGTESEETRASYRRVSGGNLYPDWDRDYDDIYDEYYGGSDKLEQFRQQGILPAFRGNNPDENEKRAEVGRKWKLSDWTDGSFVDNSFPAFVIGFDNYKISGWSWSGEYLNLASPLLKVKKTVEFDFYTSGQAGLDPRTGWYIIFEFKHPILVGSWYKKEDVDISTQPTVFDITWNGIAGTGAKRKTTFSQLGIKETIAWQAYEDGSLVSKSEPGFDDTVYATDKANLMLSRMNDPLTNGTVLLTFDAFEYYGLKLGKRINLTQTNETDIYNENNGFPLDIESISFDAGTYQVTLNARHYRNFKTTVNFR